MKRLTFNRRRRGMNILSIKSGIIVHQVNCQGVMGCGIAKQLRDKWPVVYERYRQFKFKLGQIQLIKVRPDLYVCNLAGQDRYGRDKRYTDYDALKVGFTKLNAWAKERELPVYIPEFIGSANAGGNWKIVSRIIKETLFDCEATICEK
jgi:O-acetyl-ADP-ribose deacetylase (regulator of RNase III)